MTIYNINKNLKILLSIIVSMTIFAYGFACEAAIKTIAIAPFTNESGNSIGDKTAVDLECELYNELQNNKSYFSIKLADIPEGSYTDYTLYGKIFNAQIIPFDNLVYQGIKGKITAEIYVKDNITGKIIMSEIISGTYSERTRTPQDTADDVELMMAKAVMDISSKILNKMDFINPLVGEILKVNPEKEEILFNIGANDNIKKDDTYIVFEEGDPLINPETGEVIAVKDKILAKVKVKNIKAITSTAKIQEQFAKIKKGDKIKRLYED